MGLHGVPSSAHGRRGLVFPRLTERLARWTRRSRPGLAERRRDRRAKVFGPGVAAEIGRPRPTLGEEGLDLNSAVEEFENRLIEEALRRTKGNKQAAARLLGLKRTTLVAKLRRRRGATDEPDELEVPE